MINFVVSNNECRRVGMADEADSKSVVGNHVRVQVPLPALLGTNHSRIRGWFVFFMATRIAATAFMRDAVDASNEFITSCIY